LSPSRNCLSLVPDGPPLPILPYLPLLLRSSESGICNLPRSPFTRAPAKMIEPFPCLVAIVPSLSPVPQLQAYVAPHPTHVIPSWRSILLLSLSKTPSFRSSIRKHGGTFFSMEDKFCFLAPVNLSRGPRRLLDVFPLYSRKWSFFGNSVIAGLEAASISYPLLRILSFYYD